MYFFQEKFQESLKRLRQEQQEAEKLKAVIMEKKTSWKVREILPKSVLGQESGQGMGAKGKETRPCLLPVRPEELPFA